MNEHTTEVYEDNAGGLQLFVLENKSNDPTKIIYAVIYALYYYDSCNGLTAADMCAEDYHAIVHDGCDPIEEGWTEEINLEDAQQYYDAIPTDVNGADLIACNEIIYTSHLGFSGRHFVEKCNKLMCGDGKTPDDDEEFNHGNSANIETSDLYAAAKKAAQGQQNADENKRSHHKVC